MKVNNFYFYWLIYFIGVWCLLLLRDIFISIYIYMKFGVFHIDFSFREAFVVSLIAVIPYFLINWLLYKYGKGSDYQKQKYLKEKLTYKIINERYRDKKVDKDR